MEKKLLIVDDETDLLDVLISITKQAGWTVDSASNGRIALEKVNSFKPHVILSDISMPDLDGIQLLQKLYESGSEIPVVFLSGFRDLDRMSKAWAYCAFEFLDKPFDSNNLLQVTDNAFKYGADYVRAARKRLVKFGQKKVG